MRMSMLTAHKCGGRTHAQGSVGQCWRWFGAATIPSTTERCLYDIGKLFKDLYGKRDLSNFIGRWPQTL